MPESSTEIFGLESAAAALRSLDAALVGLDDLGQAPQLATHIGKLGRDLVPIAGGVPITHLLSGLNDRLTSRIIELTALRHRLPAVDWCWLALGSEGRHEQTFVTDQDNGLVFMAMDAREASALRELFLPFAQAVNAQLAACGFALCSGDVMAGNAAWCLSFDEWREQFIEWVRRPDPMALLNASIFFDLRPMHGCLALGERLQRQLRALTVDTPAFLHLMAINALQVGPPLSFRSEPVADDHGEIDLKKFATRIFVDAARILALSVGAAPVNTDARLRAAGPLAGMQPEEVASACDAFSHLLRLRMRQQLADESKGDHVVHGLKPGSLNDVDRAILREGLRQARHLQQRIKLNYSL